MRTPHLILAAGALALGACSPSSSSSDAASTGAKQAPAAAASPALAQTDTSGPALRICADPGNMPLSNQAGEGYQNKIAQVLGKSMGLPVKYYWRTYYERGLARGTVNSGKCDVLMDMPADYEMGLTTKPYFRSTYVLVSSGDAPLKPTSLDDPALKQARIGVFQSSPARGALYDHGIKGEVQYLFYDSARNPEEHPARLVEQVAKGKLDAVESWGPVAGYYVKRNQLTMVPLNRMSDTVLEYSMSLAVSKDNKALRDRLDQALVENRDAIRAILTEYDVPLVACADCVISGEVPTHGPYAPPPPFQDQPVSDPQVLAQMQARIRAGASPEAELGAAVAANDPDRVRWLLAHGANGDALDDQGRLPLQHAIRLRELAVGDALLNGGAKLEARDGDGWTPLMTALWTGDADTVDWLLRKRPRLNVVSTDGWTPLSVAIHNGDEALVAKLLDAGAPPAQVNPAGFTPLMFAAVENQPGTVQRLLEAKVPVDHANQAGITALMLAVAAHRQDLARTLIDAGADPNHRDEKGDSALSLARQSGDADLLALVSAQIPH
ncbi:quinoprotein dehydrogenase-associated putative ABC transporter substrate-binding protein [Pseudoxanthomonas sp. JBR18]|uniref:quinoprotein dehydrogenase-associated putative ABC transporter substrate-binding protein n=1 Tax=Pseudoxanthomonas sp. JBR18 TaxID=2969308 RepID=UPI002306726A|nr:quinoprotein dehydrogenase-associated putative ABC transporter substrate-binding protein [Pseudoxanthomonas sp. JBR18]WCE04960.1 quinoprotein dehydrogenase-associated putative ABC transporter substrate-binding protein [Pseudoxanthomonas sp. JBR18]